MIKFNSKRDVDRHVSQMSQKLNENERSSRGFAIAKSYAKVNEYELAKDWLQRYLEIKPDDAAAYKFMGEIYEKLQKPEQAITNFQHSYSLNSKQNDIIKSVCRLFLLNDGWSTSPAKAKYWCELAETENIRDDNVFTLRLKMSNKDNKLDNRPAEDMILREITARPHDVGLRIRLVRFLLEEKRFKDALKYCFDLEMKCIETFILSIEWYNTMSDVLSYSEDDTWNHWCLLLITFEKQIFLNLKKDTNLQATKQTNINEVTNLLFEFDQVISKASDKLLQVGPVKEFGEEIISHFCGQLALHIASLLFQKQKVTNNDQWRETTKKCLPFLLFAFQSSTVNTDAAWLKNMNETIRNLFTHLKKEGAFRCTQSARTILSCKTNQSDDIVQISNQKFWYTVDDIFNQVRETCADLNWRKNIFRLLFANTDHQMKISSSYYVQSLYFHEPNYEMISFSDVENYENIAQHLYPSCLNHQVYLGLGRVDLHTFKAHTFNGLNLSASNLINCNPETINRIDIDSFLYCSIIQAKRKLEAEKKSYEAFNNRLNERPLILPASNMVEGLCTEEQKYWWLCAYKMYKNINFENLAQLKATLQYGIEAVRGIDSPKIDLIILLKLGDILLLRSSCCKPEEKRHLEIRVEYVYKFAMKMMKNPDYTTRLFKFITNNYDIDQEVEQLTGSAIGYLSGVYFRRDEYKEFIDELTGIQNVWAHFYRSEAYRKLDELGKSPRKAKKFYIEKARESLKETLLLLDKKENIYKDNPLRMRVEIDLKKLQYDLSSFNNNEELDVHNTSQNGYADDEIFHNASSSSFRGRRDLSTYATMTNHNNEKFAEIESLIRILNDLIISVKDDILSVRNDITSLKDDVLNIRGNITDLNVNKDANTSKALNDIYKSLEDLPWNITYMMNMIPNQSGAVLSSATRFPGANQFNQMYNTAYPIYPMQYPITSATRAPFGQNPTQLNYAGDAISFNTPIIQPPPQSQQSHLSSAGPKSMLLEALNTSTVLNTWNNTYNSTLPTTPSNIQSLSNDFINYSNVSTTTKESLPINVVITNSDPLPTQNTIIAQPTLSVTIPPQHIKHSQNDVPIQQTITTKSNMKNNYENISPSKQNDSEYYNEPADYDPRPDFKPIIPLPDEVEIKTGEENEEILFEERAKLFRFVDKEWKERGLGNIKILKNKSSNKCRIVMRREQIHKLCANHAITSEMELKTTQNETNLIWGANDYTEEEMKLEKFLVRFKYAEQAKKFRDIFECAKKLANSEDSLKTEASNEKAIAEQDVLNQTQKISFAFGGLTGNLKKTENKPKEDTEADANKTVQTSPFANFSFGGSTNKSFTELFSNLNPAKQELLSTSVQTSDMTKSFQNDDDDIHFEPTAHFEPVIPLPELIENKTGEEDENVLFCNRAKLLRFDSSTKEWKERGIGDMKVLVKKDDPTKGRLLMRREQVLKLCCNMSITKEMKFTKMNSNALSFAGQDFSDGEMKAEKLAIKFKTPELIKSFQNAISNLQENTSSVEADFVIAPKNEQTKGFGDKFKPKVGSWTCEACYISNKPESLYCVACESPKDNTVQKKETKSLIISSSDMKSSEFSFGMPNKSGFSFGMPVVQTTLATIKSNTADITSNNFTETSIANINSSPPNDNSGFQFDASKPFSFGNLSSANNTKLAQKVQFNVNTSVQEIGKNDSGFNFIFKKKSPTKLKSPGKSRNDSVNSEGCDEIVDDNEYHEEEENQTYFTPVIPLPDKIEIKTGEENEKILYSHRAKLFRFTDKEWKERGLGDLKILQHNETGKIRMVMRREQVHKICLNFFLTTDIEFKRKDNQSWTFGANDFSEGEYELRSFAIRFKSKDICDEFKKAIDSALIITHSKLNVNSEIIKKLMLPENFFSFENSENCSGCLGCKSDEYIYSTEIRSGMHDTDEFSLPLFSPSILTRNKSKGVSQDKKVSFKLAEIKENVKASQFFDKTVDLDGEKSPMNNEKQKTEATANIFNKSNNLTQDIINTYGDDKNTISTATSSTSVFSSSLNTGTTTIGLDNTTNEKTCIFGSKTNFGNIANSSSIFSSGNKENNEKSSFANTPIFGANIFGAHNAHKGGATNIFGTFSSTFSFADAARELEDKSKKISSNEPEFLKNVNNFEGFAELAASSSTEDTLFNVQKSNGTGQFFGLTVKDDFFSKNLSKQNTSTDETSHNDDENVQDDNYDPHYDPIISLPEEVKVCTGEEDEEKLFGERAKLFRYDINTKEWKERGVGEMKILHHPVNKTFRMILRREQIFKLVLNQLITFDLHISSMENSPKAFCWVGMNYAESIDGEVEQLAIRFKNEELANNFKKVIEECQRNI